MRLKKLVVKNSINNRVIREIPFNDYGLSLIVDESGTKTSGSNIGKTTAVKIIDLCLGASSISSLYKEKDTGENGLVKEFIETNKVVAELTCIINNVNYVFKRYLYKNGKYEIDGKQINSLEQYKEELNYIIFNNKINKPTLRQLISKFIRLENANENALLKFLGTYCKNYEYQAIYEYLFGIDTAKSENVNIININENIDKDIEAIYRKNSVSTLKELEAKIALIKDEVNKLKQSFNETTVINEYKDREREIENKYFKINELESLLSKGRLKMQLMKEKIKKEKEKIFSVDHRLLKMLYDETKLSVDSKLKEFEDLEQFHNGMVNKRIAMLEKSLIELELDIDKLTKELSDKREDYEAMFIDYNVVLKDKFEEKYNEYTLNKIKLETYISDYEYILRKIEEKEINLSKKVVENNDIDKKKQIEDDLNLYFKSLTNKIVGEPYAIVFNDIIASESEFPVRIIGMNGKPGTGIKKTMITCFDLAHINLILQREYHMPVFEIHDKMENIDLIELKGIVNEARNFKGQYIFPILDDRIETLGIKDEEIVLRLSAENKFFHI
jgi:uncharacterized protein YydD (DUF2326 family)